MNQGLRRGAVVVDERGRWMLCKKLVYIRGSGIRVWLERPRAASFVLLRDLGNARVVGHVGRSA